jgi:hypothetical protein
MRGFRTAQVQVLLSYSQNHSQAYLLDPPRSHGYNHPREAAWRQRPESEEIMRKFIFRAGTGVVVLVLGIVGTSSGSENVPHIPFAQWADVLQPCQFEAGLYYERSEAYHIWVKDTYQSVAVQSGGETYGIDINQGWVTLQYGIAPKWTADVSIGGTTVGWRYFSPNLQPQSTIGFMDIPLGVRCQIFNEAEAGCAWAPTLTFHAGVIFPGSYNQDIAFAPGDRSAALEPEILFRKHFGWEGLGAYGDALFRWNHTTHNDHYITSVGLFQKIKGWELDVGYRHLGTPQGQDIELDPVTHAIIYPRELRENSDSTEAGFSYTTKRHIQYGFYTHTVWSGANTDGKFWLGAYVNVPFGGK